MCVENKLFYCKCTEACITADHKEQTRKFFLIMLPVFRLEETPCGWLDEQVIIVIASGPRKKKAWHQYLI